MVSNVKHESACACSDPHAHIVLGPPLKHILYLVLGKIMECMCKPASETHLIVCTAEEQRVKAKQARQQRCLRG